MILVITFRISTLCYQFVDRSKCNFTAIIFFFYPHLWMNHLKKMFLSLFSEKKTSIQTHRALNQQCHDINEIATGEDTFSHKTSGKIIGVKYFTDCAEYSKGAKDSLLVGGKYLSGFSLFSLAN
jgi:hypothetical protein